MKAKFVLAYDGNATEAAKLAGYSPKTAYSMGSRLMQDPEVIEAIQARGATELAPAIAGRLERQAFWTTQMRDNSAKLPDRLKASELLGRSNADFTEKFEVKGELTLRDLVLQSQGKDAAQKPAAAPTPDPTGEPT